MERKKSFSRSLALALALVFVLPLLAIMISACGGSSTTYHKVTFYMDDKTTVLGYAKVEDGKEAEYTGTLPTKAAGVKFCYEFAGWGDENGVLADLTDVKKDMNVYARFTQKLVDYHLAKPAQVSVTRSGSALLDGDVIHYDDQILISYTETAGYKKSSFKINGVEAVNNTLLTVKGNVEVIYQEKVNTEPQETFKVSFIGPDGEVVTTQDVVKNGKVSAQLYSSSEYKLVKWMFDFNTAITKNTEIKGVFVKNDELITGATVDVTGEERDTTITVNMTKECLLYQLMQADAGTEADIPTTIVFVIGDIDMEVESWDRLGHGEISYSVRLKEETLDYGFWVGYFEEENIMSIDVKSFDLGFENLFLVCDVNGNYGFYKNVYGIAGRPKIEGVGQIEGAEVVRPARFDIEEGENWTLNLEKDSTIYNVMKDRLELDEIPQTVTITVSAVYDWDSDEFFDYRDDFGNMIDAVVELSLAGMETTFRVGWYKDCGVDVIVFDTEVWGVGSDYLYLVNEEGTNNYYFYTSFTNIDLVEWN